MGKTLFAILLFVAAVFAAPLASASVIRVPEHYKKIQDAVNAANPNDIIIVNAGTYRENIVIKKTVQLKSAKGPEATVVTAARKTDPVFKIDHAANVNVSGFTATGSGVSGISLHNASGSIIRDNRATGNGDGILVYSSSGNNIISNAADSNARYGIYMEASKGNVLTDNSASLNGDKGIFLSSSRGNTVTDNSANINTWNGILLWSSHGNIIKGNKAMRNTYGIVQGDSDDNDVDDNTTLPNFVLILPIILVYTGVVFYLVQKNIARKIYRM